MDKILTLQQAAEMLQTTDRFVSELMKDGQLKGHKVGKRLYILESELIEFVKSQPYHKEED